MRSKLTEDGKIAVTVLKEPLECPDYGTIGVFEAKGSRVDLRGYFHGHYQYDYRDYQLGTCLKPKMWVEVSEYERVPHTAKLVGLDLKEGDSSLKRYAHNVINGIPIRGSLYLRGSRGGGWYDGANIYRCDTEFSLGDVTQKQRSIMHEIGRLLWDLWTAGGFWAGSLQEFKDKEIEQGLKEIEQLDKKIAKIQDASRRLFAMPLAVNPEAEQNVKLEGYRRQW